MREVPPSPFVGLMPYSEEQAPFFFGRETERDLIIDNLRSSRLTVLYGTSGVGKSSVLHAGAAYRLRQIAQQSLTVYGVPEFVVVTFSAWRDDPFVGLMSKVQEAIAATLKAKSREASSHERNLAHMLGAWSKRYGVELLVILDQFEEYFVYHQTTQGAGTFAEEFVRAVNDLTLRARFLISLRDDALSKLDFFKPQIPNLFNNLLRIEHMTSAAAEKAIVNPLDAYNQLYLKDRPQEHYSIEPALVKEILEQVAADVDETKAEENGHTRTKKVRRIETPYLQLVMTRLWEKEREQGSHVLRLQTLSDLKGMKNIVQVHLQNALRLLSTEQQAIAARIFDYLVTASGTKIAYLTSDLVAKTNIERSEIEKVLDSLSASRVLRPVDPPPDQPHGSRYEVFHDVLAQAMMEWQKQYTQTAELIKAEREAQAVVLKRKAQVLRNVVIALLLAFGLTAAFGVYASMKKSQAERAINDQIKANEETKKVSTELKNNLASYDEFVRQYRSQLPNEKRDEFDRAIESIKQQPETVTTSPNGSTDPIPVPTWTARWPVGTTLHVRFLGGDKAWRDKVTTIAPEWTKYANLKFVFDNSQDAELRVSFVAGEGSWSYLGRDSLDIPAADATMNLEFSDDEAEVRKTILRVFGHVLGLINEHQNPNANIPWNKIAVYRYFSATQGWDAAIVDRQIFNKYSGEYREFDPKSVMMLLRIPKELLNGDSFAPVTELSTELSESDKAFAAKLYPKN